MEKKLNIVTCGNCGEVFGHKPDVNTLNCPYCSHSGDICHFPDLYHSPDHQDSYINIEKSTYKYTTDSIILSRADIDSIGYDSSTLSDKQFTRIGEKAGERIMEDWWGALEYLCQDKDIKPLKDSIPLK